MIVRIWRGQASRAQADAYRQHVTGSVFPTLLDIPGHRGAYLLQREVDGATEFLAVTLWDSMDAVRQFAGSNPDLAVVEPEAQAVLAEFDPFVRHYDIAHGPDCPGS